MKALGGRIELAQVRVMAIVLCMATTINAVRPMPSYRAVELDADYAQLGMIAASYAVLSVLVAVPIGRWVDRWGAARFALGGASLIGVTVYVITLSDGLLALGALHASVGLGQVSLAVALQTLVANSPNAARRDARFGSMGVAISLGQVSGPPSDLRGTALGVRLSGNRLGQLTIPTTAGVIATGAGFGAIFVATGLMLVASAVVVLRARFPVQ